MKKRHRIGNIDVSKLEYRQELFFSLFCDNFKPVNTLPIRKHEIDFPNGRSDFYLLKVPRSDNQADLFRLEILTNGSLPLNKVQNRFFKRTTGIFFCASEQSVTSSSGNYIDTIRDTLKKLISEYPLRYPLWEVIILLPQNVEQSIIHQISEGYDKLVKIKAHLYPAGTGSIIEVIYEYLLDMKDLSHHSALKQ